MLGVGALEPLPPSSMELFAQGSQEQFRAARGVHSARQPPAAPVHMLRGGDDYCEAQRGCCCCLRGGFDGWGDWGRQRAGGEASSISLAQAAAYGATMFGSAAINNIWVTYYIAFFSARVQSRWFYFGQAVYMVWNAVNDPLVGWLSDALPGLTQRRTPAIMYGGPAWALVFALAWFDLGWSSSVLDGLHFTLILCAYDGLLTYVELNHGALLADLSSSVTDRTLLNQASAVGAILGSLSSFFGHLYWQAGIGADLTSFRRFAVQTLKRTLQIDFDSKCAGALTF
jgi:hypothetical protein